PGGVTITDDCYNATPMSMRAPLDDLAATASLRDGARTVAVLGDMLELGPGEREYHVEIGAHAAETGVELLVTVGPLAGGRAAGYVGGAPAGAGGGLCRRAPRGPGRGAGRRPGLGSDRARGCRPGQGLTRGRPGAGLRCA